MVYQNKLVLKTRNESDYLVKSNLAGLEDLPGFNSPKFEPSNRPNFKDLAGFNYPSDL
jgi:hypothetical protein